MRMSPLRADELDLRAASLIANWQEWPKMNELTKLSDALSMALRDENLHALAIEPGEMGLDSLLPDGLARDVPVIGTIYGLCKVAGSVRDWLFYKKVLSFLSGISHVPPKERAAMVSRIDGDATYQIKVGEKLLYILDRSDDHESARIVAHLFAAFLSGDLSYDDFLRASRAVETIMTVDLWRFVGDELERWDAWDAGHLVSTGLVCFDESAISVEDETDRKARQKYRVENGDLTVSTTDLGKKVRAVLRSRKPKTNPKQT